jgi:type III secretion protein U
MSSGEKTEEPTPKKLRDAREKGQVAQSRDATSTALLIVLFAYIAAIWHPALARFKAEFDLIPRLYERPLAEALSVLLSAIAGDVAALLGPLLVLVVVTAVLAGFLQVGPVFALEPVKPSLDKINPIAAIKKMFSLKNLIEFAKAIFKTLFLGALVYLVIRNSIPVLVQIPYGGRAATLAVLEALLFQMAVYTVLAFLVVSAADLLMQRYLHKKELRMTKDEVKREYKENEGDPHIKSKRKQLHRELLQGGMVERSRKASVMVTNPTHLAIALRYEENETPLPLVIAKGEGILALRMIEAAVEENIPVLENVPLAHDLMDRSTLDQAIPSELIAPVAEVLRWVQELKQMPS